MSLPIYIVNAFTATLFGGNPAAVCPLESWLPDETMQQLANQNNLSETAFFVRRTNGDYDIRWFTPEFEIDLAGHPTLATAFVIFTELGYNQPSIRFHCKSGELGVTRKGDLLEMNFPARMPAPVEAPVELLKGLSLPPARVLKSRDYFVVYDTQEEVEKVVPHYLHLNQVPNTTGIIVTARGHDADFVSRFFVPNSVIGEDPVTGSAHATLIPFWANELHRTEMKAVQLSKRRGDLWCGFLGERVTIAGQAVLYMKGTYLLS